MSFNQNLQAHYANVEQSNVMNSFIKYYIDSELVALKNLITDSAPETLDTLNELAAALNDDPAFFSSMSSANTTLQTNIDNLSSAASDARTALQTALQAAIDAVQADVDQNETDGDAAVAAETSARTTAITALETSLLAAIAVVQADVDQNESDADAAIVALQADVDQNESDSDAADAALSARITTLEADPTTATAVAAVQADVDQNEADADAAIAVERGRIDAILDSAAADTDTFAEIVALINSVDTANDNAFAAYVLSNDAAVAAVQADVDQNESDSDAAEAALSGRLDTLEADPTTAAAVAAVQADVDQNEADADAAIALKLNTADPAATGKLTVDTNASLEFDSNLTKLHNELRGTSIVVGNNITLNPAAANGRVEVEGEFYLRPSDLTNAADDTAAAAAGIIVGQVYRNGSQLMIRVS